METYDGATASTRYFVRVTISRSGYASGGNVVKEADIIVQNVGTPPETAESLVKLEVGIEDCLHIEFEYDRGAYHLTDTVTGRVNFLLVRIRIKTIEVAVIRRETIGLGSESPPPVGRVGTSARRRWSDAATRRALVVPAPPP